MFKNSTIFRRIKRESFKRFLKAFLVLKLKILSTSEQHLPWDELPVMCPSWRFATN
jgi:hypothetical protein